MVYLVIVSRNVNEASRRKHLRFPESAAGIADFHSVPDFNAFGGLVIRLLPQHLGASAAFRDDRVEGGVDFAGGAAAIEAHAFGDRAPPRYRERP